MAIFLGNVWGISEWVTFAVIYEETFLETSLVIAEGVTFAEVIFLEVTCSQVIFYEVTFGEETFSRETCVEESALVKIGE